MKQKIVLIIVFMTVLVFLSSCKQDNQETPKYNVSSYELFSEFENDLSGTKEKYSGNIINLTGSIKNIMEEAGQIIVEFHGRTRCTFDENLDTISQLPYNSLIKVKGLVTTMNYISIEVIDCSLELQYDTPTYSITPEEYTMLDVDTACREIIEITGEITEVTEVPHLEGYERIGSIFTLSDQTQIFVPPTYDLTLIQIGDTIRAKSVNMCSINFPTENPRNLLAYDIVIVEPE